MALKKPIRNYKEGNFRYQLIKFEHKIHSYIYTKWQKYCQDNPNDYVKKC